MGEEKKDKMLKDGVSRRSILRMGSAALAAAAFGGLRAKAQTREGTHQAEGDHSSRTPEQESKPLLAENPTSNSPPTRDQGDPFAGFVSAC
jgi:oxalate decarboxylase